MTIYNDTAIWWITVVELPVLSGLFWLMLRHKKEAEETIDALQDTLDVRVNQLREGLMAFKLEVAKSYAAIADVKDLEARIVAHLLRIEAKLDRTAIKADVLFSEKE